MTNYVFYVYIYTNTIIYIICICVCVYNIYSDREFFSWTPDFPVSGVGEMDIHNHSEIRIKEYQLIHWNRQYNNCGF